MKHMYQSEKFSAARHCLMLPHPDGEAAAIMHAFHECWLGMKDLNENELDDHARGWIRSLKELMDTSGLSDPSDIGTWTVKAAKLTTSEKFELSRIIDELANYFEREFWSNQ